MNERILIVEDDPAISRLIDTNLMLSGYQTFCAMDGRQAVEAVQAQQFDLALCDIMLPELDGFELLPYMKEKGIPVIYVSAKADVQSRVQGLRLGAEDYLVKPFDLDEVLVRIEVVLRRSGALRMRSVLEWDGLSFDTEENRAFVSGEPIQLTAKELMLLKLFLEHPKKVYTKAELYESVWNEEYLYEDNTINVHVSNLRSKLKKVSGKDHISTVWGIGYRLGGE